MTILFPYFMGTDRYSEESLFRPGQCRPGRVCGRFLLYYNMMIKCDLIKMHRFCSGGQKKINKNEKKNQGINNK